jgi:hypothetical protein
MNGWENTRIDLLAPTILFILSKLPRVRFRCKTSLVRGSGFDDPRPPNPDPRSFSRLIYSPAMFFSHSHVRRYPPKQKK